MALFRGISAVSRRCAQQFPRLGWAAVNGQVKVGALRGRRHFAAAAWTSLNEAVDEVGGSYSDKRFPDIRGFVAGEENVINVDQNDFSPTPLDDVHLSPATKKALERQGIETLFPIQHACYQHLYAGKDVIARARTGTGKTLAFALPIVEKLMAEPHMGAGRPPRALVLSPTRELALQIQREFEKVAPSLYSFCIYGGASYELQENGIRKGIDILVGTPGRIADLLERGTLRLDNVQIAVLDEADRMLDIGFEKELEEILQTIKEGSKEPQLCLFSATLPAWIRKATKRYLTEDRVTVDLIGDDNVKVPDTVAHQVIKLRGDISRGLRDIIQVHCGSDNRCIVFSETKEEANRLASYLPNAGPLHGDMAQRSRESTLNSFKQGAFNILVATDVAARGLDIPDVQLVVQMSFPREKEYYVHRSGRTGRAGKKGTSITIVRGPEDEVTLRAIEKEIGLKMQRLPPPQPADIVKAVSMDARNALDKVNAEVLSHFLPVAKSLIEERGAEETLAKALAITSGVTSLARRSLLSSEENVMTLQLVSTEGRPFSVGHALALLEKHRIRPLMYALSLDRRGFLFDVGSHQAAGLQDRWDAEDEEHVELLMPDQLPDLMPVQDRNSRQHGNSGSSRRRGNENNYRQRERSTSGKWRSPDRDERMSWDRRGDRRSKLWGGRRY